MLANSVDSPRFYRETRAIDRLHHTAFFPRNVQFLSSKSHDAVTVSVAYLTRMHMWGKPAAASGARAVCLSILVRRIRGARPSNPLDAADHPISAHRIKMTPDLTHHRRL